MTARILRLFLPMFHPTVPFIGVLGGHLSRVGKTVLDGLAVGRDRVFVDCTIGRGVVATRGFHSRELAIAHQFCQIEHKCTDHEKQHEPDLDHIDGDIGAFAIRTLDRNVSSFGIPSVATVFAYIQRTLRHLPSHFALLVVSSKQVSLSQRGHLFSTYEYYRQRQQEAETEAVTQ